MSDLLHVYVERLRDGEEALYDETVPLEADEELRFPGGMRVRGKAYLADSHLVVQLDLTAKAEVPCTICTEWTPLEIAIENYYMTVPLEEIPSGVYSIFEGAREGILLEVPSFAECGGSCPERAEMPAQEEREEANFPFKDL